MPKYGDNISATSSGVPTGWSCQSCLTRFSHAHGALDLALVAAHGLAVAAQDLILALDRLEASPQVVGIRVLRDQLESHLLAAAADQDRESRLERRRVVADVDGVVVRAGGRGRLPVEHASQDRQSLAEPAQALRYPGPELDPEIAGFVLVPGRADPQVGTPAADVIQGGCHLGHQGRVPIRVGADHEPDPDPLGGGGPGRDRQPALEERPVRVADDRV